MFDRYFFLVDIGNVPLTISVTPCSSVVSMTILWRTMPDDEEYYYYDDDDEHLDYDVGVFTASAKLIFPAERLPDDSKSCRRISMTFLEWWHVD